MELFSPKTLDFLFENRLHDSKEWFEEHKEDYKQLVFEPLRFLSEALGAHMLLIDQNFITESRVDKTISRIRRDTRFSHDKSLYRDNMWLIFKRGKLYGTEVPGMYFEISNQGFSYGCGFYEASTACMNIMRERILAGDKLFQKARESYEQQSVFQLVGNCYKKPHYLDQPEELRVWLERRGISVTTESKDFELLFSDRLSEKLAVDFQLLKPVYHFFLNVACDAQAPIRQ